MTNFDYSVFVGWIKKKIELIKKTATEKIEPLLNSRKYGKDTGEITIYLAIFVYTIVFSYFTILKHYAFKSFAWDFGINQQILSTTINDGKLFYYTPEGFFNSNGCYFGLHFSPILFLLLPIYALNQAPETLLVFQSLILALAALPLYWFARDRLKSNLLAVGFSLSYLLYPPLHGANWFDFHLQSFLPLFFFSAMYFFESKRWGNYFIFIILALSVGESVPLVVIFIGLYGIWTYRHILLNTLKNRRLDDRKILVPLATVGLATLWLLVARWIQSTFFPINPTFSSFYRAVDYWKVLGIKGDPISMPLYVVLNPLKTLQALFYDGYLKLLFFTILFGSLLFLPLQSFISIITLPSLLPALLSNHQPFYVMGVHYPLYYIPFIFLAAIAGLAESSNPTNSKVRGKVKNILILIMVFSFFASPISPLLLTSEISIPHFSEYRLPNIGNHEIILQGIVELIPQNASVLTQNNIFPHFSNRINAYVVPLQQVFDYAPRETEEYLNQLIMESDYVLFDMLSDQYAGHLLHSRVYRDFVCIEHEDGIYLYRKGSYL